MKVPYLFDMAGDQQFIRISDAHAPLIRDIAPTGGYVVEEDGREYFNPVKYGIIGRSASGKSTFFRNAVEKAFDQDVFERTVQKVDSWDQKRLVTVWSRWVADGFEIRTADIHAMHALPHHSLQLHDFDRPGILAMEHLDKELEGYCDLVMRILHDKREGRQLLVEIEEDTETHKTFQAKVLPAVSELVIQQ